jgi:excisionase family DNA binding protein
MTEKTEKLDEIEYLTIKQAAKLLQTDTQNVTAAIKAGQLPAILLGKRYRISRSALAALGASK